MHKKSELLFKRLWYMCEYLMHVLYLQAKYIHLNSIYVNSVSFRNFFLVVVPKTWPGPTIKPGPAGIYIKKKYLGRVLVTLPARS